MAKIVLNNSSFHLTSEYLPCLIHGVEHSGSSFFSIACIADLMLFGQKILFFTAYPMARDVFLSLTTDNRESGTIFTSDEIEKEQDKTAILVKSGDEELFLEAIEKLKDLDERIIFIKNIEAFSEDLYDAIASFKNILFAGDIDRCKYKEKLLKKDFQSIIMFSDMQATAFTIPELGQYEGLMLGESNGGIIVVK